MTIINPILFILICVLNIIAMWLTVKILQKFPPKSDYYQWQNLRIREKNKIVSWLFKKSMTWVWIYKMLMLGVLAIPLFFDIPYWNLAFYIITLIIWSLTALNNYKIFRKVFKWKITLAFGKENRSAG